MNAPRYWAELTTADFGRLDLPRTIAVLPVAATEQHGPHLPLSVDTAIVDAVVRASLDHVPADLTVLFLPTQSVGLSPEHARFQGTLTLRSETIIRLWTDIAESVAASGISKLVLLNAHGGQVSVMDIVARDLRNRLNMLVYSVNWFNLPMCDENGVDLNAQWGAHEQRFGVHAGAQETAMMLAIAPDTVHMEWAQNFQSSAAERAVHSPILGNGRSAKLAWQMQDYNPLGAAGHAAAATTAQGQALLAAAGRSLAQLLVEVDRLPVSTLTNQTGPFGVHHA
jgi:creatinine amidohydrolase